MKYYVVDSFADEVFKGNPAGVCVLDGEIASELMQNIAMENNLSETAFTYKSGERYKLRWFTPGFEINLCGHATLATAYVILEFVEPDRKIVEFETLSGVLTVERKGELYEMSFPKLMPEKIAVTDDMITALSVEPAEVYSERDLYVVLENEEAVKAFVPDYSKLRKLKNWLGVVVTAKGEDFDFVSRYFCPELDLEDPVTGSSHSSLVPLWSAKLGKDIMVAKQLSKRGGVLYCENSVDRVKISGRAVLYMQGEIKVEELFLVRPSSEHKVQYEEMMNEWEGFGGRLNPGALRRFSNPQKKNVTYDKWLEWIEEDRQSTQDLYFLTNGKNILGAISIRYKSVGIDGHIGFGIRPSERNKGYASRMLALALPIIKKYGHSVVEISCDKENIGSAKTIINNGGQFIKEVVDEDTGKIVQMYHIYLNE